MSSKTSLAKGNWICPDESCGNMNFPKRDKCNRCGKKKKDASKTGIEIGKAIAEKSKGLFSADDWMCKSCGNINWARRTACNICNTSKVNTQGQRTGYGGGFYEREDEVEYIDRNDSDDEYDEFGMKKKKYRGHTNQNADISKKEQSNDDDSVAEDGDDENDEPDDDSEGGDLSKYDLWGDDEKANQPVKANDDQRKRRSKSLSSNSSYSSSSSGSSSESSGSSASSSSSSSPKKTADGDRSDSKTRQRSRKNERSRSRSPIDRKDKKH